MDFNFKFFRYLISITISPLLLLIYIIFSTYQYIIKLYLIQKHGQNFDGFLSGKSARFAGSGISKSIINGLYIIDFNTTDSKVAYDLFLDKLKIIFDADNKPKISSCISKNFGYYYFLKNQVNASDVVSTFADALDTKLISMEKVQEFLSHTSCVKMPKNNTALVEFIISDKPIKYMKSTTTFAVIFRFPHYIMDGPAFVHFLFYNNILCGPTPKQFLNAKRPTKLKDDIWSTIFNITFGSYDMLTADTFRKKEWNFFHKGELSSQKLLQWIGEEEINMLPKILEIRKRTGVSVTHILTIAIAASLKQFAKKRNNQLERTTVCITFQSQPIDISESPQLTNTFGIDLFDFPLNSLTFNKTNTGNLKKFMDDYIQSYVAFDSSNTCGIVDTFLNVFGRIFTTPILNMFCSKNITFQITNMGTFDQVKFWTYDLKEMLFFPHNDGQLGMAFAMVTFGGKLRICLTADRRYLHYVEEADEILQNIFGNVNQLLDEVLSDT